MIAHAGYPGPAIPSAYFWNFNAAPFAFQFKSYARRIIATLAVHLGIYNAFVSLLRLLMAFTGDQD